MFSIGISGLASKNNFKLFLEVAKLPSITISLSPASALSKKSSASSIEFNSTPSSFTGPSSYNPSATVPFLLALAIFLALSDNCLSTLPCFSISNILSYKTLTCSIGISFKSKPSNVAATSYNLT